MKTNKKIGLFGGTFDPVHTGHLIIAEAVREQAGLDVVIFIPSAHPPHKKYELMFDAARRFRMLTNALESNPHFIASDIEMNRTGPSYTIDTLKEIKEKTQPGAELSFIVGRDNLYDMVRWKNPEAIVKQCTIIVAERICNEKHEIPDWLAENVKLIDIPLIGISSSEIRRKIREDESIRYLVPDAVLQEIQS